jgi:hypothetical protein
LQIPTATTLAASSPEIRDAFYADESIAAAAARSSIVPKQASTKDGHWKVWENFVATFEGVDPYLEGEPQSVKLSFLKVFATRIRLGAIAPSGQPVRGRTVEDYLWTVGEEIALDDDSALDSRYSNTGWLHPAISKLQMSYTKDNPPPMRVKPIPLPLVTHAVAAYHHSNQFIKALMDQIIIAFFFLLRPGEHSYDKKENHPFRLQDVSFQTPAGTTNAAVISDAKLALGTKVHLQFTNQKNGIKGEHITHGDNTEELLSPLKAIHRRVQHLRTNNAPPETPLHTVFQENGTTKHV